MIARDSGGEIHRLIAEGSLDPRDLEGIARAYLDNSVGPSIHEQFSVVHEIIQANAWRYGEAELRELEAPSYGDHRPLLLPNLGDERLTVSALADATGAAIEVDPLHLECVSGFEPGLRWLHASPTSEPTASGIRLGEAIVALAMLSIAERTATPGSTEQIIVEDGVAVLDHRSGRPRIHVQTDPVDAFNWYVEDPARTSIESEEMAQRELDAIIRAALVTNDAGLEESCRLSGIEPHVVRRWRNRLLILGAEVLRSTADSSFSETTPEMRLTSAVWGENARLWAVVEDLYQDGRISQLPELAD